MRHVLNHIPVLVRTYGKWPSFVVVLLASIQAAVAVALVILLHHMLR